MSARHLDYLLDDRARLVARNTATEGHLWAAEFLLRRVRGVLTEAIMATPALAAHRDVLVAEIDELLAEDRLHPAAPTAPDVAPPEESGEASEGGAA